MRGRVLFACAALAWVTLDAPLAQQAPAPPYKVTPLMKAPFTADPNKEAVMVTVEWPANVSTPWHTHAGDEYTAVVEGSLITQREGEEPKTITAGQSYHQPTGVVHMAKTGDGPAKTINLFVVDKGKPLSIPVQR
jgi:quercetin dioxygenase-like cupin family protein